MVRRCRSGHSLPELIVAVTFLGACLGVVGATAAAAGTRTRGAVLQQEAVRRAGTVLDSLLAAPGVQDGELRLTGMDIRWAVLESGATPLVEVTATGPDRRELIRLEARWFPPEWPLPWPEAAAP